MRFQEFQNEDIFWQMAQEVVELCIHETLRQYPTARIALAGGSTPQPLYQRLSFSKLPWGRIQLVQTDERYVPMDDAQNNGKMIQSILVEELIPQPEFLRFDTEVSLEESAAKMNESLRVWELDRAPVLDLIILGMGADGHIASLFPGQEELWPKGRYAFPVHVEGNVIQDRLTLSLEVLKKAKKALILIKGEEKRDVWENLKEGAFETLKEFQNTEIHSFAKF